MDGNETSQQIWTAFVGAIRKRVTDVGCKFDPNPLKYEEEPWFRGEGSRAYKLLPSLFRKFADPNNKQWDLVRGVECDLFYEFAARARQIHSEAMSDWDILFAMQHHGTPTRLLDWTEALGVAVYFAIENVDLEVCALAVAQAEKKSLGEDETKLLESARRPKVWVLNPYRLNTEWGGDLVEPEFLGWDQTGDSAHEGEYWKYGEIVASSEKFGWERPVAIYPRQKTERMYRQNAWFTIHGDVHQPLEAFAQPGEKPSLLGVELPLEAVPAAWQFLEIAGINRSTIYPDLSGLSDWLKRKYRLTSSDPVFNG